MTFDLAKSFWNYNDPTYGIIKNRITEGTLKIVANGNDDYTITGSFKAIDEDDKIPSSKSNTPENFLRGLLLLIFQELLRRQKNRSDYESDRFFTGRHSL